MSYHYIQTQMGHGYVLQVNGGNPASGTRVQMEEKHGRGSPDSHPWQFWTFMPSGIQGEYYIKTCMETGFVLTVHSAEDGARPVMERRHPDKLDPRQLWLLINPEDRYPGRVIMSVFSGKVLDIDAESTAHGAPVVMYSRHNGNNQKWLLST